MSGVPPRATYRVQLTPRFGFDRAAAVVDYLARLGVSHLYCSPYLQAAPGSEHGYDVVDHSRVNEELGGEEGHARLCAKLAELGLGQVLDMVPNHMAINGHCNRWWWDVLENGPSSRYASYFDVSWDPPERKLKNRILLPALGDHYGRVLEAHQLRLVRQGPRLLVRYYENEYPIDPRTYGTVLGGGFEDLAAEFARLPVLAPDDRVGAVSRHQQAAALLGRLQARGASDGLDACVERVNSDVERLDELLEQQNYRLARWQTAGYDLDYRRFFDVNSLAALRAEDPEVFAQTHRRVLEWADPAVLYGRGALVPKGPDTAWLAALQAIRAVTGTLPVNIAFLAEGDEILGSQSYAGLIERYRDRLEGIDGCVYFRAAQNSRGELPLILGYKAFITFELVALGRGWGRGPVEQAAHSATSSIVDSPALRLVQALTTIYRDDGRIGIEGWRDHLLPAIVPEADRELMDLLARRLEGNPLTAVIPGLAGTGVSAFVDDLEDADVLTRYVYGSGLNIQGIYSGYTGPGARTYTIPEQATARLDARLVTDAPPATLLKALRQHLDHHGFGDIEIRVLSAYPGSRTDFESALVQSFVGAAQRAGGEVVAWPMQGYGGPWSIFAQDFGAAVVFASGIGHGAEVGLPDEYIVLDGGGRAAGLREMQRFYVDFLASFAATGRR